MHMLQRLYESYACTTTIQTRVCFLISEEENGEFHPGPQVTD